MLLIPKEQTIIVKKSYIVQEEIFVNSGFGDGLWISLFEVYFWYSFNCLRASGVPIALSVEVTFSRDSFFWAGLLA